MAEKLGDAVLELSTDDKRLKKGLARSEKSAKKSAARIKSVFASIATAAVLTGLKRSFDTAIDGLDNIAKSADKIGITTDSLQELRLAADLSGVSSNALDTALRKFSRSVDEASQGVAEYKESFDRLGVSVTDTEGNIKPIEQLIGEVADGMNLLENATTRAAISQDLFGRAGVDLINLTSLGSKGIDALRDSARKLGIVIDESIIREAVIAKDELTILSKVISVDMTLAIRRLGPLIIGLSELLAFLSTAAANAFEGFDRLFKGTLFIDASAKITKQLEIERAELVLLADELKTFGETGQVTKFLALRVGVEEDDSFDGLFTKAEAFRAEIDSSIRTLEDRLTRLGGGVADVVPPKDDGTPPGLPDTTGADKAEERRAAIDSISDALTREIGMLRAREAVLGKSTSEMVSFLALQEARLDLHQQGIVLLPDEIALLERWTADLGEAAEALATLEQAQQDAEDAARDHKEMIDGIGDSMADAVFSVRDLDSALEALTAVIQQVVDAMLESQGVKGGLGGLFSKALQSALGAAGGGAAAGFAGATGTGFAPGSFGGFAHGGSFKVGGAGGVDQNLVAFRATRGERVDVTPAGGGEGGVLIQVINNTPVKTREETATGSNGEQVKRLIIDEVGKATARGELDKTQQARFGAAPVRIKR